MLSKCLVPLNFKMFFISNNCYLLLIYSIFISPKKAAAATKIAVSIQNFSQNEINQTLVSENDSLKNIEPAEKFPKSPKSEANNRTPLELRQLCKISIKHHGMYGTITSPFYPHNYENNITCIWGIRAPPKHLIEINIREFILEGGTQMNSNEEGRATKTMECVFDYLYIFEQQAGGEVLRSQPGSPQMRKALAKFCGYKSPVDLKSTIPGSRLYFYFHTDESKTEKGFFLMYRIMPEDANMPSVRYSLDEDFEEINSRKEEEFIKVFSCIIFIFIFTTIMLGTLYKCWKSTANQIAADGHAQHSCCCGAIQLDVIAGEGHREARMHSHRNPPPRLPTPPPEYGDVVKTEEEWNRALEHLGEASVTAIRQRLATEEVQVTYDLNNDVTPLPPPRAASSVTSLSGTTFTTTVEEHDEGRPSTSPTILLPPPQSTHHVKTSP